MEITILISDKLFVITISKTASRYVESYINLNDDSIFCGKISFDGNMGMYGLTHVTHKGHIRISDSDTLFDYVKNEYESIINQTSLKDVVILYRSPIRRNISAISQDLSNIFSSAFDKSPYGTSFLKYISYKFFNLSISEIQTLSNIEEKFLRKWNTMDELQKRPYVLFLNEFLQFLYQSSFITPHSIPYLNFVYVISNQIDHNKLYLMDIDEVDISNHFSKYIEHPPYVSNQIQTSNNSFNEVVKSLLDTHHLNKMQQDNKGEMLFYNLLKTHNRNYINQSET